ncbi:MAG: COX15/CtaA family protein [bacterium]
MQAPPASSRFDVLVIGFGTTVSMWSVGYISHLPFTVIPSIIVGVAMLLLLVAGGWFAGRFTARGWRGGFFVGLISSILNLLVLGSLLSGNQPNEIQRSMLIWLPGSLLLGAVLGAIGGALGNAAQKTPPPAREWTSLFAGVASVATYLLLVIGGLVTSKAAGLAVVDWPNSFGYNMFLYPLSRMTGGIYFEHAHRLFGALVGLTALVLAIRLWGVEERRWLKKLGALALLCVIVQGVLGGLRVTGHFTLSTSPNEVAPNLALAVVHGVLGQIIFSLIVAIAVVTSATWRNPPALTTARTANTDHLACSILIAFVIVQLVLGAIQRHFAAGLHIHITLGVLVVGVGSWAGARAWGLYPAQPLVSRLGLVLTQVMGIQFILGMLALVGKGLTQDPANPPLLKVITTTAHQAVGALALGLAVVLALWIRRLIVAEESAQPY